MTTPPPTMFVRHSCLLCKKFSFFVEGQSFGILTISKDENEDEFQERLQTIVKQVCMTSVVAIHQGTLVLNLA